MEQSLTLAMPATGIEKKTNYWMLFGVLVVLCVVVSAAWAVQVDTAVDPIWEKVKDWGGGAPGKIMALLSFLAAVWYGIVRPNYTNAIGALLFCLMMANAVTIIEGFMNIAIG